jgi:hypothetical protein
MPRGLLTTEGHTAGYRSGYRRAFHGNFAERHPFFRPPVFLPHHWTWIVTSLPEEGPRGNSDPCCSRCKHRISRTDEHLVAKVCLCAPADLSEPHDHVWHRLCNGCARQPWIEPLKINYAYRRFRHRTRQRRDDHALEWGPTRAIAAIAAQMSYRDTTSIPKQEADQAIAEAFKCSLRTATEERKRAHREGMIEYDGRSVLLPERFRKSWSDPDLWHHGVQMGSEWANGGYVTPENSESWRARGLLDDDAVQEPQGGVSQSCVYHPVETSRFRESQTYNRGRECSTNEGQGREAGQKRSAGVDVAVDLRALETVEDHDFAMVPIVRLSGLPFVREWLPSWFGGTASEPVRVVPGGLSHLRGTLSFRYTCRLAGHLPAPELRTGGP